MIEIVRFSDTDLYRALFDLSQSIAGHADLQSLCEGLARSLQRVVEFDFLGLALYDAETNRLRLHVSTSSDIVPHEQTPSQVNESFAPGWVWIHQRPIALAGKDEFNNWPAATRAQMEAHNVCCIALVPLTHGDRRLGVLGFGSSDPERANEEQLAFLHRVASEFAVTVDSHLTREELKAERDRLEVLFDITNTLVSKLDWDELLREISDQLRRVVAHDVLCLSVPSSKPNMMEQLGLHVNPALAIEFPQQPVPRDGLPSDEAMRTGTPILLHGAAFERYSAPVLRQAIDAGMRSGCSVPLMTKNGVCGSLDVGRLGDRVFAPSEVRMLVQVGSQIAIALENSIAYKELHELKERLANEKLYLEDELAEGQGFGNMIGESLAFQSVLRSVQVVAPTDATVLILGETGTGKELIARAIHDSSARAGAAFVKVNCAAIPAGLLESDLFGHEKGAFTSAGAQKLGRFELAHKGTLFLDEVGEIPLELQSKLLRAIQEQEFERVGGTKTIKVDIRIVAATNRDLKAMVDAGQFRADLYYRLHVFPLAVPALRERREDIPLLVRYFVQRYATRLTRPIRTIPTEVMDLLTRYDWPGNVRELQNVLERSVILSPGESLHVVMPEFGVAPIAPVAPVRRSATHDADERERILAALQAASGVVSGPDGAAARLGLKRTTLQARMKRLGIGRHYS